MDRRTLLGAIAGLLVTAGCTSDSGSDASPTGGNAHSGSPTSERDEPNDMLGEFHLTNDAETGHTFEVTVERRTDDGQEVLLDETYDLTAGAIRRFRTVITDTGSYRIRVAADTGATTTYTWSVPRCDDYDYLRIWFAEGELQVEEMRQTIDPPPTCARDRAAE